MSLSTCGNCGLEFVDHDEKKWCGACIRSLIFSNPLSETPMKHLIPSPTPGSIYYADLFRINGKLWMIQGHGKSQAGRIASNNERANDLARDAVAIIRDKKDVYGRYDVGGLNQEKTDLHKLHKLDYIAFCLDERRTNNKFISGIEENIIETDIKTYSMLCSEYQYPASIGYQIFSEAELSYFRERELMTLRFIELLYGEVNVKLLLVPFMESVEKKAQLYETYRL